VKRDDLTSRAYGGNKVRKLQYFLGQALADHRSTVVTFGAYGSNHALATAVHARALGIEAHAMLTPQVPTAYARATVLAHAGLGTVLHPIEGNDDSQQGERLRVTLRERDGCEPLMIPVGGSSALGAVGFVYAALELTEQAHPDAVYRRAGRLNGCWSAIAAPNARRMRCVTPATVAN
jgi:D-cysteine desulfhydrase/L-cysteate sulfo-lyase